MEDRVRILSSKKKHSAKDEHWQGLSALADIERWTENRSRYHLQIKRVANQAPPNRIVEELYAMQRRVAALEAKESVPEMTPDPVELWRTNHRADLQTFAGKRVAIHPTKGVVDSDADLGALLERLGRAGIRNEVVIQFVRPGPSPKTTKRA